MPVAIRAVHGLHVLFEMLQLHLVSRCPILIKQLWDETFKFATVFFCSSTAAPIKREWFVVTPQPNRSGLIWEIFPFSLEHRSFGVAEYLV